MRGRTRPPGTSRVRISPDPHSRKKSFQDSTAGSKQTRLQPFRSRIGDNLVLDGSAPDALFYHGVCMLERPERLNPHHVQALAKLIDNLVLAQSPSRSETPPENPTCSFKDALSVHVVRPLVWAVIFVAIALYGKSHVACALNYHVDPVGSRLDLGNDSVSAAGDLGVHVALKPRFAEVNKLGRVFGIEHHRLVEVRKQTGPNVLVRKVGGDDGAHQVHPVLSTACRNVESLIEHASGQRLAVPRIGNHRKEHDVALASLKRPRVSAKELPPPQF